MKSRTCQNCSAAFDRHDLAPFLSIRLGNTINCLHCLDLNYLIPKKSGAYWVVFCLSTALALFIFSLFLDMLGFMGLRPDNVGIIGITFVVAFCIVGILLGAWIARFILKIWNWRNGDLTLDDSKQSILDLG